MIKLRVKTWLAVSFFGAAASLVASSAFAVTNTCQVVSTDWSGSLSCHGGNGHAYASVDSSGNKTLEAWLVSGNYAGARGLAANGSLVSTCSTIDSTVDLNSTTDSSGCNSATPYALQHSQDN